MENLNDKNSLEKMIIKHQDCFILPKIYEPDMQIQYTDNLKRLEKLKIYDKKIYNHKPIEIKMDGNFRNITELYELVDCDFEKLIVTIEALRIICTNGYFWLRGHHWANRQFQKEIIISLFKFFQTPIAKTYKMDTYLINNQSHPTKPTQQIIQRAIRDFKRYQIKSALNRIDDYINRNNDEPYTEMLLEKSTISNMYFICKQILREAFMTRMFDRDNIPIIKTIDNFDDFAVKTLLLSSDLLRKFWTNILEISLPDDQSQATQG